MIEAELGCTCERCWRAFVARHPNVSELRARAVFEAGAAAVRRALERAGRGRPTPKGDPER